MGTTEKTSIDKFCDYLAQYLVTQDSPTGNHMDYYCSKQEFHDIIKHLCNVGVVEVSEFQLNLAGNIINFKNKEYDKRETKTNIN